MGPNFEITDQDAAGRIGELDVPRADVSVETPALMPVINPHLRTVEPATLQSEFGAEILITNAYIFYGSDDFREAALERGLHDLLEFDGAIMTDSGAFQLAEYGEIDVTTEEILEFQYDIGTDIGTPVDIPTPPDVDRDRAEAELATTQDRLEFAAGYDTGDMLVTGPVQGSTFPDLREAAGTHAVETGLDVFPIGAVVPLMNAYRFADMVDVVAGAKRGLGPAAPVHLFGAGHPMMFALAVAMGCDLFDSAAYAIYARDGRYLTVRGTHHLEELDYFPCSCPICAEYTPADIRERSDAEAERLLARHNLHISFGEIRRIKQALRAGTLLELVDARARSHPAMVDGYRTLLDYADQLERTDPVRKGTFFQLSAESSRRPEVRRHQRRLDRFDPPSSLLITVDTDLDPDVRDDFDAVWRVLPPFGPFPSDLTETYPLTAEVPDRLNPAAYEHAADGIESLADAHPETAITLAHDGWPATAIDRLPAVVELIDLTDTDTRS